MSRQGLMDDSGYDFFDVSDCANYESCREEAYNDGYEKGRADQKEEDNAFFNFEGAWELEKKKVRADAIDECMQIVKDYSSALVGTYYYNLFIDKMEQLKEQK